MNDHRECWKCGNEGYAFDCLYEGTSCTPEDGCDLCMRRCNACRLDPEKQQEALSQERAAA